SANNANSAIGPGSSPLATPKAGQAAVVISNRSFTYLKSWEGEILEGPLVAIDTETSLIEGVKIPQLALASASSGTCHCLIHPRRLGSFVQTHRDKNLVFQNAAFDFWVVVKHLQDTGEAEALRCWWAFAEEGRLHDTLILDMLVRLALHDAYPSPRN